MGRALLRAPQLLEAKPRQHGPFRHTGGHDTSQSAEVWAGWLMNAWTRASIAWSRFARQKQKEDNELRLDEWSLNNYVHAGLMPATRLRHKVPG